LNAISLEVAGFRNLCAQIQEAVSKNNDTDAKLTDQINTIANTTEQSTSNLIGRVDVLANELRGLEAVKAQRQSLVADADKLRHQLDELVSEVRKLALLATGEPKAEALRDQIEAILTRLAGLHSLDDQVNAVADISTKNSTSIADLSDRVATLALTAEQSANKQNERIDRGLDELGEQGRALAYRTDMMAKEIAALAARPEPNPKRDRLVTGLAIAAMAGVVAIAFSVFGSSTTKARFEKLQSEVLAQRQEIDALRADPKVQRCRIETLALGQSLKVADEKIDALQRAVVQLIDGANKR
jgi:hypothetical protein